MSEYATSKERHQALRNTFAKHLTNIEVIAQEGLVEDLDKMFLQAWNNGYEVGYKTARDEKDD